MDIEGFMVLFDACKNSVATKYVAILIMIFGCYLPAKICNVGTQSDQIFISSIIAFVGALLLSISAPVFMSFVIGIVFFIVAIGCLCHIEVLAKRDSRAISYEPAMLSALSVISTVNIIMSVVRL